MKTTLKVLSIIIKIVLAIFSIVGIISTIAMVILAKPLVNNMYDMMDDDNLDPDDEDQDIDLSTEAYRRTISDPRANGKFINALCHGVGKFIILVANL